MRIMDLFSGAGGLTFGFYYRIRQNKFVRNRKNSFVFANEIDPFAAEAFEVNFPDIRMINEDIKYKLCLKVIHIQAHIMFIHIFIIYI